MDFPDWLLTPLFIGLPVFIAIKLKIKKSFREPESIFLWSISIGLILSIPFYFLRDYLIYHEFFLAPVYLSDESVDVINLANAFGLGVACSLLLICLGGKHLDSFFTNNDTINNALEEDALFAIQSHIATISGDKKGETPLTEHMVELKNGKIYIGIVTHVDLKDDGGYLKLIPIRSGFRLDGKVETHIDYKNKEIVEKDVLPPEILLPKLEIISFRQFNAELDSHFNSRNDSPR